MIGRGTEFRISFLLAVGSAFSAILIIPYLMELNPTHEGPRISFALMALTQGIQALLLSWILSFAGLRMGEKVSLGSPYLYAWILGRPQILPRSLVTVFFGGLALGIFIQVLDRWILLPTQPDTIQQASLQTTLWKGWLAAFYGGWTEEVLTRLFLMTSIVWVLFKIFQRVETWMYWFAIFIAAICFAALHLPQIASLASLTLPVVMRVTILNLIGGITFGFLYWRKGLEHSMVCHFATSLSLHSFF